MPFLDHIRETVHRATRQLTACVTTATRGDDTPPRFRRLPPNLAAPRPVPAPVDFERIYHGTADQHARRAVTRPDEEWIGYALARGADINGQFKSNGDTLLMRLLRRERGESGEAYACIRALMGARDQSGATVDLLKTNHAGDTALHVLARQPDRHLAAFVLSSALHSSNDRTVDDALKALDSRNADGHTPEQVAEAAANAVGLEALQGQRRLAEREKLTGTLARQAREIDDALDAAGLSTYPA